MAMRFEHEFTVPVPVDQAWPVLLDVERVAPCLPGAAIDSVEGTDFTGRMKVKVGPITVTYNGKASFEEIDKDGHAVTLKASGRETRGSGTASATVHARLLDEGGHTKVTVETSFNVTGRPAQFGRGVMAEVGAKLIDRFAENLAELLRGDAGGAGATGAEAGEAKPVEAAAAEAGQQRHLSAVPSERERPGAATRASRTAEEEALDLLEVAGVPVLKRALPALGALAAVILVIWLVRRFVSK